MKTVAVSQRVDVYPDRKERRDAVDQRLITLLVLAGLVPVPIPNALCVQSLDGHWVRDTFDRWLARVRPRSVLLSGGNDIGAYEERDLTEGWLLDYAEQRYLPALGICRGMQMMGVRAGSTLRTVEGHVRVRHGLTGKIEGKVYSYHSQVLSDCPRHFSVLARSTDGEIEAIRHNDLPWEGWMWHPEREAGSSDRDMDRLKELLG